ncbi:MAG: hypothetical protein JWQ24_5340 [Tardiphaga sp.]|nr:hypothetical protein [Tardiphaga sp.]
MTRSGQRMLPISPNAAKLRRDEGTLNTNAES